MRFPYYLAMLPVLAACAHAPSEPLPPRPEVTVILPPALLDVDDVDISDPTGLEPAPFPEPPGDSVPESTTAAPEGLDLSGTSIPLVINPRVQYWLDIFTGPERDHFATYLSREGRFEGLITQKLRDRGLPEELLYLALIESGFSPVARSRAKAVGMWQFVTGTARIEGLEVSEYLDERRNVELATDAALNHLEKLHDRYNSWYLAAAAYNSGAGRVDRAIAKRAPNADGSDSLFWRIHAALPRETRDYVPKLIAATIIGRNRDRFGFGDVIQLQPVSRDTVTIPDATDLSVIAGAAGVSVQEVIDMNPQLPKQVTPPGRSTIVYLPPGTGEDFRAAFANIPPEQRVRFLEHTVKRGETLGAIAHQYGTSVGLLQETNGIKRANQLRVGQRLRIPRGSIRLVASEQIASRPGSSSPRKPSAKAVTPTVHKVKRGETLSAIARHYGVRTQDLLEWNALRLNSVLHVGDRLVVKASR